MPSRRVARVASRMRFLVSSVIQRDLHDPRLGFITVLRVEPTADLKEAKVFYSVLGNDAAKSKTIHALETACGYIQKEVGKNLETRNTPRLRFVLDETQDRVSRVESLIEKAVEEDRRGEAAPARDDASPSPDD